MTQLEDDIFLVVDEKEHEMAMHPALIDNALDDGNASEKYSRLIHL